MGCSGSKTLAAQVSEDAQPLAAQDSHDKEECPAAGGADANQALLEPATSTPHFDALLPASDSEGKQATQATVPDAELPAETAERKHAGKAAKFAPTEFEAGLSAGGDHGGDCDVRS